MTVDNEGSTQTYAIPPSTIFNLNPYKDHVGEQVICVSAHNNNELKVGKIYIVIEQKNPLYGYIRLEEFKKYKLMWFAPSCFKRLKATYDGNEYKLSINIV